MRLSIFLTVALFINSLSLFAEVTISDLQKNLISRLDRVQEFAKIKKLANEVGVKEIYLFGGTASAWAHYVYADLEREDGKSKFYKEHFDYDFTSIFRSNQDMDIAIDGSMEQAEKIEAEMAKLFPFFQGKKSVFEVRLLNSARGDKDAIIGNPDFLNQNNDSHSTGLIEILGDGKKTVRDVKDMSSDSPRFLRDVFNKKLHFYYDHALHATTKRFKEKKNPEILAAVRYLTKAFQYELSIDDESYKNISAIIKEFDPKEIAENDPYVAGWLERNAIKLFQNAVNMEYAWNTLEKLGLRKRLIEIHNNPNELGTLSWWMNKEPLRTTELGHGNGKTAQELGLDIVAHETRSFEAYESITKAHSGDANVFISRSSGVGEAAAHGDGFYVRLGKKGAGGTGITIRFHLDPEAREGSDFLMHEDYLIIKNKKTLHIIPESIQITPLEYFKKLSTGEIYFDATDLAVQNKVSRKITNALTQNSVVTELKIASLVRTRIRELLKSRRTPTEKGFDDPLLIEWFNFSISKKYPQFIDEMLNHPTFHRFVLNVIVNWDDEESRIKWIKKIVDWGDMDKILMNEVLTEKDYTNHYEIFEQIIEKIEAKPYKEREKISDRFIAFLHRNGQITSEKQVDKLLKFTNSKHDKILRLSLSDPTQNETSLRELFKEINERRVYQLIHQVFASKKWYSHPHFFDWQMELINSNPSFAIYIIDGLMNKKDINYPLHPEFVLFLSNKKLLTTTLIENVFKNDPRWLQHPELILKALRDELTGSVDRLFVKSPAWKNHPYWKEILGESSEITAHALYEYAMTHKRSEASVKSNGNPCQKLIESFL